MICKMLSNDVAIRSIDMVLLLYTLDVITLLHSVYLLYIHVIIHFFIAERVFLI